MASINVNINPLTQGSALTPDAVAELKRRNPSVTGPTAADLMGTGELAQVPPAPAPTVTPPPAPAAVPAVGSMEVEQPSATLPTSVEQPIAARSVANPTMVAPQEYVEPSLDTWGHDAYENEQRLQAELDAQKSASASSNVDWETIESIGNAYPSASATDLSAIYNFTRRAVTTGSSTQMNISNPAAGSLAADMNSVTPVQVLMEQSGISSDIHIGGLIAQAAAILNEQITRGSDEDVEAAFGKEKTSEELDDVFGDQGVAVRDDKPSVYMNRGVPINDAVAKLGEVFLDGASESIYDADGKFSHRERPSGSNASKTGAALLDILANEGSLTKIGYETDPDTGKPIRDANGNPKQMVYATTDSKMAQALRNISDQHRKDKRSFAQRVPADPVTGGFIGERAGLKGKQPNERGGKVTDAIRHSAVQHGRVPRVPLPVNTYVIKYIANQVFHDVVKKDGDSQIVRDPNSGQPIFANISEHPYARLFSLDEKQLSEDTAGMEQALKQNGSTMLRQDMYASADLASGELTFNPHKWDTINDRLYDMGVNGNMQANLQARAMYGPPAQTRRLSKRDYHNTGVSPSEAAAFWANLRNKTKEDVDNNPDDFEKNFLLMVAHTYSGINRTGGADDQIGSWTLDQFTPQNMRDIADWGRRLIAATPQKADGSGADLRVISGMDITAPVAANQDLDAVLQEISDAFKRMGNKVNQDNIGPVINNAVDMARYMDAKINKLAGFAPQGYATWDMKSAGLTGKAVGSADDEVLVRNGMTGPVLDSVMMNQGIERSVVPKGLGTHRDYFTQLAIDVAIPRLFGKLSSVADKLKGIFKKDVLEKGESKNFAKSPLLKVDYGQPTNVQFSSADGFLGDNPDFEESLLGLLREDNPNASRHDVITMVNDIYRVSLNNALNWVASNTAGVLQRVASMVNEPFLFEGVHGELKDLVGMVSTETGEVVEFNTPQGPVSIPVTEFQKSVTGRGARKTLVDYSKPIKGKDGKVTYPKKPYQAPPGSLQVNMAGPAIGQYMESMRVAGVTGSIAPTIAPPSKTSWFFSTHDSMSGDASTFARTLFEVNNGKSATKVENWYPALKMQEAWPTFTKAVNDKFTKLQETKGAVDIGLKGDMPNFLVELENQQAKVQRKIDRGDTLTKEEAVLMELLKDSTSGYRTPQLGDTGAELYSNVDAQSRGNVPVSKAQAIKLFQAWLQVVKPANMIREWAELAHKSQRSIQPAIAKRRAANEISLAS